MEFMELKEKIINGLAMGIYQQEISWRRGPSEEECLELATKEVEALISFKETEIGGEEEEIIKQREPTRKREGFWIKVSQIFFLAAEVALFVFVFSFVLVLVYRLCEKLFSHF
jgi:hypothetical protein